VKLPRNEIAEKSHGMLNAALAVMAIQSFRVLLVWRRAMSLAEDVYAMTNGFPRSEQYGLALQIRRAAVSIPSNLAEGHPQTTRVYLRHVMIAIGSEAELQTQLELAGRLKFADKDRVLAATQNATEIGRMLRALASSLAAIDATP
jgi:four helix bundle protein